MFLITLFFFIFCFNHSLLAQDISPSVTSAETITPSSTPTVIPPVTNIFINEFMPAPEDNLEWVEIYNDNDYSVILNNWKIDDMAAGGGSPKIITNLSINAKGLQIIELGGGFLNNGPDSIRLINDNDLEVEKFDYSTISNFLSYSKVNSNWCLANPSKASTNNTCFVPTHTPTPTSVITSTPTPTKTPTPTHTPTSTKTPTQNPTTTPTRTPTPTLSVTPINSPSPKSTISPTPTEEVAPTLEPLETPADDNQVSSDILGISDLIMPTPTKTSFNPLKNISSNLLPGIFITSGALLLLIPLIVSKLNK